MYDEENNTKGIILATILCAIVIIASRYLFPQTEQTVPATPTPTATLNAPQEEMLQANTKAEEKIYPVEQVLQQNPRIEISNAAVKGSIRVEGARFDDLMLDKYKQTLSPDSPDVELLTPAQTESPYFAEFGWLSTQAGVRVPNSKTVWQVKGKKLTPESPIVLEWNNGQGLRFVRTISLDKNYMFTIADSVENNYGCATCLAMSMMGEQGLPSACESDVMGALTMLAMDRAAGSAPAYMDWNNNIREERDKCLSQHCSNFPRSFFGAPVEIENLDVLSSTLGAENCFGCCKGQVAAGPMTFAKLSTDDFTGRICAYVGEGEFLDEPMPTKGGLACCRIENLQGLMKYICSNGFEHHVAFVRGHVADVLCEAFGKYLGYSVYRHVCPAPPPPLYFPPGGGYNGARGRGYEEDHHTHRQLLLGQD